MVEIATGYGMFVFSNNHAPFKDINETTKYFDQLYLILMKNRNQIPPYRFIFGDLNSRSLILDGQYKKKIEIPNNDDSLIKKVEKYLEKITPTIRSIRS